MLKFTPFLLWIITWIQITSLIPVADAASEQPLSLLTSSSFELLLSPVRQKLDTPAVAEVKQAIETLLFSTTRSDPVGGTVIYDLDTIVQQVQWLENGLSLGDDDVPTSSIKFTVLLTYFQESETAPTRFSLDSSIIQAFSRPSTKIAFQTLLSAAESSLVSGVSNTRISQVFNFVNDDEPTPAPTTDESEISTSSTSTQLSVLDIVLIVASVSIFLGILYMIYQNHKDRMLLLEERRNHVMQHSGTKTDQANTSSPRGRNCMASIEAIEDTSSRPFGVEGNIEEGYRFEEGVGDVDDADESLHSTLQSKQQEAEERDLESPPVFQKLQFPPESNVYAVPMPPLSPCGSMSSSGSSVSRGSATGTNLLGAPEPMYGEASSTSSREESMRANTLSHQVQSLPDSRLSSHGLGALPNSPSHSQPTSVHSAPPAVLFQRAKEFCQQLLSSSSSESTDGHVPNANKNEVQTSDNRDKIEECPSGVGLSSSKSSDSSNGAEFTDEWFAAKKEEQLQNTESSDESIDEAVHMVGALKKTGDESASVSRMSGMSAVVDWVKAAQVMKSPTSSTSNSSAEHTPVIPGTQEPPEEEKSEASSLEHSMARSFVDV